MKKICISIIMILGILSLATIKVNAAQAQVNVGVIGEVKAGSNIDIVVDIQKMTNLYAASMDYTYDNSIIKVEEIIVSSNIDNGNIYQAYKDTASGGNKARYGYTNVGDFMGFNGDTNFLVIKAKILKDGELNLTKDNFKLKLVEKQGSNGELPSEMLCNINYPKESWEVVKSPSGTLGETTYVSILPKVDSLSSTSVANNKNSETTQETTAQAEEKSDVTKEDVINNNPQAEEKEVSKDESKSYWTVSIIGLGLVAIAGFLVYKRIWNKKNKLVK